MTSKKKLNASDLKAHVGYWLRVVSNHVSHAFAKKLESSDVTVAEWVVLREMYSGDETTSPSKVAELTGLTRGAVSKLVDRLLQKSLVTRTEASADRRFQDIRLTPQALGLVPKLAALADQNDVEFFGMLTSNERKQLREVLEKLAGHHNLSRNPIG
jgi:MarR family transcriptional regulator, transcriptional regulator for hemolysin